MLNRFFPVSTFNLSVLLIAILISIAPLTTAAEDHEARIQRLEAIVVRLEEALAEKDRQIEHLETHLHGQERQPEQDAFVHDTHDHTDSTTPDIHDHVSEALAIAAFVHATAGASDAHDEEISDVLQSGSHDPKQRGLDFQQLKLAISGSFDPYMDAEAHIIFTEDDVELEEAFVTTSLAAGLALTTGYFLTEFGRINPAHLHEWDWIDQPIVNTRIFGGEGTRGSGMQLSWQTPASWESALSFSVQDADEFAPSFRGEPGGHGHGDEEEAAEDLPEAFGEEGVGGRPFYDSDVRSLEDLMYVLRWHSNIDLSDDVSARLGFSGMWGRNGNSEDSHTWIYGADLTIQAAAAADAHDPRWSWQTEIMRREYATEVFALFDDLGDLDPANDIDIDLPSDTLEDWGLYTQFRYAVSDNWSVGVRYEWAGGSGDSAEEGQLIDRDDDPARGDRMRLSPMLQYQTSEFSRLRLQYNYDEADFISSGEAHSIWLGLEILMGAHAAH